MTPSPSYEASPNCVAAMPTGPRRRSVRLPPCLPTARCRQMSSTLSHGIRPNLARGDEVPQIFTRKPRLRPSEFLTPSAKRLLQQYRHDLPRDFRTSDYLRDCPPNRRSGCASQGSRTSREGGSGEKGIESRGGGPTRD